MNESKKQDPSVTASQGGELKKTAKHSAIYAVGTMISRLTGLVMLPIYTRYLTPADYGIIELFSIAIELMGILIGLRITQAMFRYYILEDNPEEKRIIISTVLQTVILASGLGTLFLYLGSESISLLIFGTKQYQFEFQLFAFTLMTNAISAVGLAYIRARRKPVLFVTIGVVSLALQVMMNILFVVVMDLHVTGVVYSALLSGVAVTAFLMVYVFIGVGFKFSRVIFDKLIAYVSPLILASLGTFFVAYADKYFIRLFGTLTEVGLYALAIRISSIVFTVYQSFNMSWSADRYEIVKKENAKELFNNIFKFLGAIFILLSAGLSMFANDFFRVMTSPEFYSSGNIVPVLVLGVLLHMLARFCNFGIMLKERTRYIAESAWIRSIIAVVGYVVLIPPYGVYGAALALLIGNAAEFYWVNRNATRLYDMGLQWWSVISMFMAALLCVAVSFLFPFGDVMYFGLRVCMFILLMVLIYAMPVWDDNERNMMKKGAMKFAGKLRLRR